ncbi:hypothetical protein HPB52_024897 [Rhipicephalus sanguineus]|uniref:Uncharacterized protein n=1 Tax=Rhipicephalus sanguineus TaxID=34632 RepID=A0A9D4TDQ4_RHISA|nr:hypothetical protein HPB52_024897 [Rhipicephalus sanguineus]
MVPSVYPVNPMFLQGPGVPSSASFPAARPSIPALRTTHAADSPIQIAISGGGTISAGPTYLIQELRHHNTPSSSTKGQNNHSPGGSNLNTQQPEKILFLKTLRHLARPFRRLRTRNFCCRLRKTRSRTSAPRSYPPLCSMPIRLLTRSGGLSGPVTGGLLPDGGQDGLL